MLMGFLNSYGYDISWENNATSTNPCIEEQGEQRVVWIRIIKPVSKRGIYMSMFFVSFRPKI
jgi:hypothetical protein